MSPTDSLEERLRAIVGRSRLPIDDDCRLLLDRLIDAGASRFRTGAGESEAVVEDGLRLLLDDMTQQARILRFDALHVPNLVSALERSCPLGPFC